MTWLQVIWLPIRNVGASIARRTLEVFGRRYRLVVVEGRYPKRLAKKKLYVLTEDGLAWEAAMICPCGCGATLNLNLLPDEHPLWRYSQGRGGLPTLHPSVWRQIECRSHFVLRDGRVIWA
jgi:hypothetical protein